MRIKLSDAMKIARDAAKQKNQLKHSQVVSTNPDGQTVVTTRSMLRSMRAKQTRERNKTIYMKHTQENVPIAELSKMFGLKPSTISSIVYSVSIDILWEKKQLVDTNERGNQNDEHLGY